MVLMAGGEVWLMCRSKLEILGQDCSASSISKPSRRRSDVPVQKPLSQQGTLASPLSWSEKGAKYFLPAYARKGRLGITNPKRESHQPRETVLRAHSRDRVYGGTRPHPGTRSVLPAHTVYPSMGIASYLETGPCLFIAHQQQRR